MLRQTIKPGFHPNTTLSTLNGNVKIKDLYSNKNVSLVWTYNEQDSLYELNKILVIKNSSLQKMVKIIFDDNSYLILSPDYHMISDDPSCLAKNMKNRTIRSFEKDQFEYINHYPSEMIIKEIVPLSIKSESYSLVSHTRNNCAIIPHSNTKTQKGIIVYI